MKTFLRAAALCAALLCPSLAAAQTGAAAGYPNHPVRILVPFAPGGIADVTARLLSEKLTQSLGKSFYVENHGGAGGNIGTAMAAATPPDGYTLCVTSSSYVINPSLHAKVPYDPIKDLVPITIVGASPNVLTVYPNLPVHSVKELIDYVKTNPGNHNFATSGVGTTAHLAGEMFRLSLGLDMIPVPFASGGPSLQSTLAGHTEMSFSNLSAAVPLINAGSLRALGVSTAKRTSALPDVPTFAEAGLRGQESATLLIILVPAATPKEIVDLLYREIAKAVALPDIAQRFDTLGFDPMSPSPEESAVLVKQELNKWAAVIRDANIPKE